MSTRAWILVTIAAIAVCALGAGVIVAAQSGSGAATDQLHELAARGPDDAVVAIVNGEAIPRRAIDVQAALALQGGVSDTAGRPIANLSKDELLDRAIENVLLRQAAEKAGVVVTEDEVTLAIHSGLIDPLSSPDTPAEIKRTGLAALAAAGLTLADVEKSPETRAAYRQFLILQRYPAAAKRSREELLASAKSNAGIQVFRDVLNAAR